ncbi:hypothetical protein RIF29_00641 [Crotalaria pallida]|uniref:PB1-like domain-containing protein n=1 Tax=Crotalaria pallida TaxID=3830 RepID=A0AAN9IWV1_CROPI
MVKEKIDTSDPRFWDGEKLLDNYTFKVTEKVKIRLRIHHGGKFVGEPVVGYSGGEVHEMQWGWDLDTISSTEVGKYVKSLGYQMVSEAGPAVESDAVGNEAEPAAPAEPDEVGNEAEPAAPAEPDVDAVIPKNDSNGSKKDGGGDDAGYSLVDIPIELVEEELGGDGEENEGVETVEMH